MDASVWILNLPTGSLIFICMAMPHGRPGRQGPRGDDRATRAAVPATE